MIFATTPRLAAPGQAERAAFASATPRDLATHDSLCATVPALAELETGAAAPELALTFPIRVAAWNLERCLFPEPSAQALAGADLVLLSELDHGMARTAQVDTAREIARHLGLAHAFGVEFLELGLGSEIERDFCTDPVNRNGFHGNAILARTALIRPFLLRLPGQGHWFCDAGQPRLGGRIAVGAEIATTAGPVVFASTHLESSDTGPIRGAQMAALIAALDTHFPGVPALIGGDLNTGNCPGGDWRTEPLFDIARAGGFIVAGGPEHQPTTRPSLITRFPDRAMKLDWFLARGLKLGVTSIHPSLAPGGHPLSDHDRIETTILALI
ncbi:endonuclease/exonuclease/phosphatase family protein [Rhodobacter lacus]|uniref:Endonuclease/exonuclease/phosphatase family protein n=1 Tax=Rhodobacter lacus TaxID=1641972 RepID=A0ABW5A7C3_9RHOB